MSQEPKRPEPVIDGDNDDAVPGEVCTVIEFLRSRAEDIAAAMDPEHDRQRPFAPADGSPHVEIEAVFACFGAELHPGEHRQQGHRFLRGGRAEVEAFPHSRPGMRRLRSAPAQLANGRRGIRDSAVELNVVRRAHNQSADQSRLNTNRFGTDLEHAHWLGRLGGRRFRGRDRSAGIHDKINADPSAVVKRVRTV